MLLSVDTRSSLIKLLLESKSTDPLSQLLVVVEICHLKTKKLGLFPNAFRIPQLPEKNIRGGHEVERKYEGFISPNRTYYLAIDS